MVIMARMHSRKHGKSGSKKPLKKTVPWLSYDKEETEKLILKLAKEGKSSSEVGLILRDQYGIPDVRIFWLRIVKVMEKELKSPIPEDMYNLMKKAVSLHRYLDGNKKDAKAKHGMELLESKIRRLGKYYARTGRLPGNWKYSLEKVKLIVK